MELKSFIDACAQATDKKDLIAALCRYSSTIMQASRKDLLGVLNKGSDAANIENALNRLNALNSDKDLDTLLHGIALSEEEARDPSLVQAADLIGAARAFLQPHLEFTVSDPSLIVSNPQDLSFTCVDERQN